MRGPGERLGRRKSAESGKTYPGAIWLGPQIIAVDSLSALSGAVGEFDQFQAILIDLGKRRRPRVDPVKESELDLRFS